MSQIETFIGSFLQNNLYFRYFSVPGESAPTWQPPAPLSHDDIQLHKEPVLNLDNQTVEAVVGLEVYNSDDDTPAAVGLPEIGPVPEQTQSTGPSEDDILTRAVVLPTVDNPCMTADPVVQDRVSCALK
jgi:hypothetical protein